MVGEEIKKKSRCDWAFLIQRTYPCRVVGLFMRDSVIDFCVLNLLLLREQLQIALREDDADTGV